MPRAHRAICSSGVPSEFAFTRIEWQPIALAIRIHR